LSKHLDKAIIGIDPTKIRQLTGSCLCGGVSYKIDGPVRDIVNCYCEQCRKTSGHHVAATRVNKDHLEIINDKTLQWFECLPEVFAVMAGALDAPTNLKTIGSIFNEDASDYCEIPNFDDKE